MNEQIIDIPWIGPSMNKVWAGVHWSKRKKIADQAHEAVHIAVKQQKIKAFDGPVSLEVTPVHKGRHYDVSNYALTIKAIEDGLVLSGILQGDSTKYVKKLTINCPVVPTEIETLLTISFMRVRITGV